MSAHHPKASMIGATSVSTPMVLPCGKKDRDRPSPQTIAGHLAVGAYMTDSRPYEVAYAMALKAEKRPKRNLGDETISISAKPRQIGKYIKPSCYDPKAGEGSLRSGIIDHLLAVGFEITATEVCREFNSQPLAVKSVMDAMVKDMVLARRRCIRTTFYALVGADTQPYTRRYLDGPAAAGRACTIDGIHFVSLTAAMKHFDKCREIIRKWADAGVSSKPARKQPSESANYGSTTCTIDGIHFASLRKAETYFGKTRHVIKRWAIDGVSSPDARTMLKGRATKPCTIDGIHFETLKAAMEHFNASGAQAREFAATGKSRPIRRNNAGGNQNAEPCTIDGVKYESQRAACFALNVSKRVIARWALAGASSPITHSANGGRPTNSGNPITIDGIRFPTQAAAAAHFNVSHPTAGRYAMRGTSAPPPRKPAPPPREAKSIGEASRKPCTIDGVTYESKKAAGVALNVSKKVICRWAIDGNSGPLRRQLAKRAATAPQAPQATRTRKNSQTPSSGAISQSGAQIGGL